MKKLLRNIALLSALVGGTAAAGPLSLTVYNPGDAGIFPVTSTLVSGEKEALLIDAQFSTKDGEKLVEIIKDSGKKLTTIYISGGDPDFYFGLQPIVAAFPEAKVLASSDVVAHIEKTKDKKIAFWGPKLGEGAPSKIHVPAISDQTELTLEGETLEIKELNTHQAYIWAPSIKTVLGGVSVFSGDHVWTADTQTTKARSAWIDSLNNILQLKPKRVIPGHYSGSEPAGTDAVTFTRDYLISYEKNLAESDNSAELIEKMTRAYPELGAAQSLAIGAKVNTGEMGW